MTLKPAINLREALAMLDKIFFEENDVENEVLRSVVLLKKNSRRTESNQRNEKLLWIFLSNDLM